MKNTDAQNRFVEIEDYYRSIPEPKYRNVKSLSEFKERYEQLRELEVAPDFEEAHTKLVNAMSQIISKLEKRERLEKAPEKERWSNFSERGMNKVVPAILKSKHPTFPVEWTDRWGNQCSVSNGYWGAKNYRVMDAVGYMFLLKEGGDRLPDGASPLFNDLFDVEENENQLNAPNSSSTQREVHSVSFTDEDFRRFTGLKLRSSEIMKLLLETSRVEFKLTFPVRLKSTGNKENTHRMNYFSRFFELAYENVKVRKDNLVQLRKYRIVFNTHLGELFVNNLLAKFNNRIDQQFYLMPASAQVCYRRLCLHNNLKEFSVNLTTLAEMAGLSDENMTNLVNTIERSILEPLKEFGYIENYEKREGLDGIKYYIWRNEINSTSDKEDIGSVKLGCRVRKK